MLQLSLASSEEFDAFALTHPAGNFHQTSTMARFRETLGWDTHLLLAKEQKETVGALVLAGKAGRYEVSMGPLLDFSSKTLIADTLKQLELYVKRIGGISVMVYPYEAYQTRKADGRVLTGPNTATIDAITASNWKHKGFTVDYDYTANRWVFVKDLSAIHDEASLLTSYRQTTRQTVKKLVAADYSIKKLSYEELEIAKELIDSSNDRNEVNSRPLTYYQKLFRTFGDSVEFLVVYYKKKTPISTGIFISHPNELVYFLSGANTKYRHLYGGHFLQHYVMGHAIQKGVTRYNFYGISGHFTHNPLLVYKSGFRGTVEEYVGGFTKIVNPAKYTAHQTIHLPKKILRKIIK